jgi:hypothetical protein
MESTGSYSESNDLTSKKRDFYFSIRENDAKLSLIERNSLSFLKEWTGCDGINVGSFGLLLNISSSDIDIGIGANPDDIERIRQSLEEKGCLFKAERVTRKIDQEGLCTSRFVYLFQIDGIDIDISVYLDTDLKILSQGLFKCRKEMSLEDRIEHVWQKNELKLSGNVSGYANYKIEPYEKFCKGFLWKPLEDKLQSSKEE